MVMSFEIDEALKQLERYLEVYTLRPRRRKKEGKDWYNLKRCGKKEADIWVEFVKEIEDDSELWQYLSGSGFADVALWKLAAKDSKFLYHVTILNGGFPYLSKETSTA